MALFDEVPMKKTVLVRADANQHIGSGHVMRCAAIAREFEYSGGEVLYVVSDEESARFVREIGFPVHIFPGDPLVFAQEDAQRLAELANAVDDGCILVDSYAVTKDFFDGLSILRSSGVRIAYIDDLYTFEEGYRPQPSPKPVDVVVNYSFSASEIDYFKAYCGTPTTCLIGPLYAPVRKEFKRRPAPCHSEVRNILVTSGSTNQNRLLENLVDACLRGAPQASVSVVVGKLANYEGPSGGQVDVLHNVKEMAPLMEVTDLAFSAAGSTLYELATIGVPTVAIASTENQSFNAEGFKGLGLGPVFHYEKGRFIGGDLESTIANIVGDCGMRAAMVERASDIVDGGGARRIAKLLRK